MSNPGGLPSAGEVTFAFHKSRSKNEVPNSKCKRKAKFLGMVWKKVFMWSHFIKTWVDFLFIINRN